mmetsp:Transcript_18776/g.29448  ORF Transcript_18776/g.29448 Transcript_18776/m.29448 type:complete len:485 (-) Transcript_18776:44-1498(-)
MDMDHLPDILTRSRPKKASISDTSTTMRSPRKRRANSAASQDSSSSPDIEIGQKTKCVITGKVARYRDPKTMMGYYDLDAFKELRRRLDAGELPKKEKKKKVSTKQPTKRKAQSLGNGAAIIARLSSTRTDVKVRIKVGNVFVPPPKPADKKKDEQKKDEKKKEKVEDRTPNKPRWDDASENMYAKPFSSLKRRRSPSISQNGDTSQQELGQPKPASDATGKIDASSQNGNKTNSNDVPTVQSTAGSDQLLSMPSTATAAVSGKPTNGATVNSESGAPSTAVPPKKSNAELKPTSAELNTFMQSWISRPENKDNLMPSLQQKQQIMEEISVDKKRLEGWFYRTRKKMRQDNPPDIATSLDAKPAPQVIADSYVTDVPSNSEVKAEPQVEKPAEIQVDKPAEKDEVESSQKDQNDNSESKSTSTPQSYDQSNGANQIGKPSTEDKHDKNDTQMPLLPTNGSKICEQTPSKQIQNMISKQSEIQTT